MIRAVALCLVLATAAGAQATLPDQTSASTRLAEARDAVQNASTAERPVAALAVAVKAFDDGLIAARQNLRDADAALEQSRTTLDLQSAGTEQLLVTLMRSSPNSGVLPHPDGPADSLRASLIAADAAASLRTQADVLGQNLRALAEAEERQAAARDTLSDGLTGAEEARRALSEALAARAPLPRRFEEDAVRTALISANAQSFGQATELLSALYPASLPNDAVLVAKGHIPSPATGRVLTAFGTANAQGQTRTGMTLATPSAALVVSPTAATILYQGPLLTFDMVVILEPTAGMTITLAGLAEVYGQAGQIIPAGTPLGIMGGELSAADTNLTTLSAATRGGASQALYLEVRERQTPVDPARWFAVEQQVEEQ